MADPSVKRWRQSGKVYLWRYRDNSRNYPGWNMTTDVAGCSSLLELLDLIDAARWSCTAAIRVSRPTPEILNMVGNMAGAARWSSRGTFVLRVPKGKVTEDHWDVRVDARTVTLTLGVARLPEFRQAVIDLQQGEGDFGLGPPDESDLHDAAFDRQCLSFWWIPGGGRKRW